MKTAEISLLVLQQTVLRILGRTYGGSRATLVVQRIASSPPATYHLVAVTGAGWQTTASSLPASLLAGAATGSRAENTLAFWDSVIKKKKKKGTEEERKEKKKQKHTLATAA